MSLFKNFFEDKDQRIQDLRWELSQKIIDQDAIHFVNRVRCAMETYSAVEELHRLTGKETILINEETLSVGFQDTIRTAKNQSFRIDSKGCLYFADHNPF